MDDAVTPDAQEHQALPIRQPIRNGESESPSPKEKPQRSYEERSLRVQTWIAVATSIYALIAIFQLSAMKSTLEETKASADAARLAADAASDNAKTARLALDLSAAPEIQPEAVTCSTPLSKDTTVTVHFRNTGGRRARDVHIDWAIEIPGVPIDALPKEQSLMLIGVGQTKKSTTSQTLGASAGEVQIPLIRSGQIALGLSGRIDYQDVFGRRHWTTFSYRYQPNSDCGFDIMNVTADE